MTSNLVIFIFAGRRENMEVQMPYLDRILETYPEARLDLWDLTRKASDQEYLRTLEGAHDGRVHVLRHLHSGHPIKCLYPSGRRPRGHAPCRCIKHKPPYEQPYRWYAQQGERITERTFAGDVVIDTHTEADTIYVKMDDDVLFLETDRFGDLIDPLDTHPNRVISANVVNNSVCAKYQWDSDQTANHFEVGDPALVKNDERWWELHTDPKFALWCHERFMKMTPLLTGAAANWEGSAKYIRTRPGEAVSINCIAFTYQTMVRLAKGFEHEPLLGDEGAVDRLLPWIALTFHAAHLSFGPQDKALSDRRLDEIRNDYRRLRKEYLND